MAYTDKIQHYLTPLEPCTRLAVFYIEADHGGYTCARCLGDFTTWVMTDTEQEGSVSIREVSRGNTFCEWGQD
jgi:hypothetical protein